LRARGSAVADFWGTHVAEVAEVSLSSDGRPRVHRVVCAVDCGVTVNPEIIKRQMKSAIIFALSSTLYGKITLKNGRVEQSNFHDYPILRINDAPEIEVHIVHSDEKPTGIGEAGTPPLAPAVVNALFALTGKRIRKLPLDPAELRT
jgi:isoquinoline 1-oxidoreductase beta subunit